MVSAPGQPWLEFYSIVVPEGLFSPRMARLAPGDALYVEKAPADPGTLRARRRPVAAGLGHRAVGLPVHPARPAVWSAYRRIILVHGVRTAEELAYREEIKASPAARTWSATSPPIRAAHRHPRSARGMPQERLTTLIADGRLEARRPGAWTRKPPGSCSAATRRCWPMPASCWATRLTGRRGIPAGRGKLLVTERCPATHWCGNHPSGIAPGHKSRPKLVPWI